MSGSLGLMPVTIVEWKPLSPRRNSLLGFLTIKLGALKIKDCTFHESAGKYWAALPAKPMIDRDGGTQRDEKGKIRYVAILEWDTRAAADRFSESVAHAMQINQPDLFR